MKTINLLLLFVSGFAFAQPSINNPAPYRVCDDNADGFAAFDFNIVTPTIINQPGTEVLYYLSLADSQSAINPIDLGQPFVNTSAFNQTIYIRAWDVADPSNPSFTSLNLIVSQKPNVILSNNSVCFGNLITITAVASPADSYTYTYTLPSGVTDPGNVASFTSAFEGYYAVTATNTTTGCVSNFAAIYASLVQLPVVSVSASAICDGNPAFVTTTVNSGNSLNYIWTIPAGATDPGSSPNFITSVAGSYSVIVTDTGTGCTSNPVPATVSNQTSITPTFSIQPSVCGGYLLPLTSDNGITGTWSPAIVTTGTIMFTPNIGQCASSYSTFITVNDAPNVNQAPNLVVNTTNNNAIFDLTSQNAIINNGFGIQFEYFLSLLDAQNNISAIGNPLSYTNTSNPQTIYIRVVDPGLGSCSNITSFNLVINNPNNVYIPDANFKAALINLGVDTNFDTEIQFTEAAALTTELNVNGYAISDLTGIEAFTNLMVLRCASNNLSNLNVSTLTNLIQLDSSYNHITNLDCSNLTNLKILNCSYNAINTLNVTALNLLEELNCSVNQLVTLNVNSLTGLKLLVCSNNSIATLSLSDLPNLERIEYEYNQSTSFTLSNLPNLKYLDCSLNFYLPTVDPSAFPLLEHLDCRYNSLTALNISGLSNLNYLDCSVNQLTTLNLSGLNNLVTLYANNNYITNINLTNLSSLLTLNISYNQLSILDLTGTNNLNNINCGYNLLSNLNITGLVNLIYLYCQNNQLSTLDFTGLTNLYIVQCDQNLLTSLDFSGAPNLYALSCSNNNLNSINIKNGNSNIETNSYYSWSQNPLLTFVCVDEGKLAAVNQILNQSVNTNNGNVVFNTYCSFVPGGNFNTITGQIKFDSNNNGCDASDLPQNHIKVTINDGSNQGATFTDANGNYKFFTQAGNFTLSTDLENTSAFSVTPQFVTIPFSNNNSNLFTQDFCIAQNGSHQDLEIVIEPIDFARPGMNATYKVIYKNKGNLTISGDFNLNYDDQLLNYTSATLNPNTQSTGNLNWNFSNLLPFESKSFNVIFQVNSSSATPPVNIGTLLNFNTSINPIASDDNQADNQFSYSQPASGAYIPNAVTCLEGELVSSTQIGNYLHYAVRFENTGSYLSENVVLRFTIDLTKYDINSVQILNASNPVYTRIAGNVIEFVFEGINLAAPAGSPPVGGHGDVLFKIRTNDNLVASDTVLQKAAIYFDYKYPIETNDAETTFAELSTPGFEINNSVKIYPNPTNSIINIDCDFIIDSIELYDIQGRILETHIESATSSTLDISGKSKGIYFLKIKTERGNKVEKIVKE